MTTPNEMTMPEKKAVAAMKRTDLEHQRVEKLEAELAALKAKAIPYGALRTHYCSACDEDHRCCCEPVATPAPGSWQPIETAPKDLSYILLFFDNGYPDHEGNLTSVGFWSDRKQNWWLDALTGGGVSDVAPTHWQPLPAAPDKESDRDDRDSDQG